MTTHPLLLSLAAAQISVFVALQTNLISDATRRSLGLPPRWRDSLRRATRLSLYDVGARPYTLLTHMLGHADAMHLLCNTFTVLMLSPPVLMAIRPARFLGLYCTSGVVGGLSQLAAQYTQREYNTVTLGSSGALAGVLLFHCVRVPHGEVAFLMIPIKNSTAGAAFIALNAAGLAFQDSAGGGLAYASHLGGALTGASIAPFFRGRAPPLRFR